MSESIQHMNLVLELIKWIKRSGDKQREYIIFSNSMGENLIQKPPFIDSFVPDVYAVSSNGDRVIIGEAKTINDVESRHSREQYAVYLRYCSKHVFACIVIAVPWTMVNCVKSLFRSIKRQSDLQSVEVIFLEGLPE